MICTECNGSKTYVGFTVVEPCRGCEGKGFLPDDPCGPYCIDVEITIEDIKVDPIINRRVDEECTGRLYADFPLFSIEQTKARLNRPNAQPVTFTGREIKNETPWSAEEWRAGIVLPNLVHIDYSGLEQQVRNDIQAMQIRRAQMAMPSLVVERMADGTIRLDTENQP
jgi:hypothetical protein